MGRRIQFWSHISQMLGIGELRSSVSVKFDMCSRQRTAMDTSSAMHGMVQAEENSKRIIWRN